MNLGFCTESFGVTLLQRRGYLVAYDLKKRIPLWTYEKLVPEFKKKGALPKKFRPHFIQDKEIPKPFRSRISDFASSKYNKGHLCAAANHASNDLAWKETFLLSNVTPQEPSLNQGYWNNLEQWVRNLTKTHQEVHVYSGSLFLTCAKKKSTHVRYKVIGASQVAVPTHFFKTVLLVKSIASDNFEEKGEKDYQSIGFIVPNRPIGLKSNIKKFSTTVAKVEKTSGIIFFKNVGIEDTELINIKNKMFSIL